MVNIYEAKNSTRKTSVPPTNTIINAMKHSRSITAAVSIHSRRILVSLSNFSRFSSTSDILVSSRSKRLVNAWWFGTLSSGDGRSVGFPSPTLRRVLTGSLRTVLRSTSGCVVAFNDRKEANRSQISLLAWNKQAVPSRDVVQYNSVNYCSRPKSGPIGSSRYRPTNHVSTLS